MIKQIECGVQNESNQNFINPRFLCNIQDVTNLQSIRKVTLELIYQEYQVIYQEYQVIYFVYQIRKLLY